MTAFLIVSPFHVFDLLARANKILFARANSFAAPDPVRGSDRQKFPAAPLQKIIVKQIKPTAKIAATGYINI
ncbi:MAG TPA: hypothetical protein DCG49_00870 [Ruminococcus sp.]|nr:hypothetical protein [Ruminococcus sp.]